ncbi:MAG TPA: PAS domain-containing sensor histidine kinase [Patescibacteria group bacterium]|nr:PAS domain-containing sensor histidine kinase [Patescibacteria group bacterium]
MTNAKQPKTNKQKIGQQETRISALKVLLNYYQDITETIREPFIILNKELLVVTANDAFYSKFKVLKEDTENQSIYRLGNNQWDTPELRKLLENILPEHRVLNNYEVKNDFPDIGPKVMLLNARQVDSKQLILLAITDVTKQRKFRNDSAKMTAGLIKQHDRLKKLSDAKDEFIMVASHQLRTPATAVKQYVGMLLEGYGGKMSKTQTGMLSTAYESNERQLEIIEDLLRVAKVDEGKVYLTKSSYNVVRQIEEVIKDQLASFDIRQQTIVFDKPAEPVIVYIDKKLMRMVLDNLLDNASKYSYRGGQILINLKQTNKYTIIAIKDKGVGILKKDHNKLFQRFSRIDNPLSLTVSGTGLGLYWVKKILDLHEGSMEVISKFSQGSTFTIKLPILDDKKSLKK